jgi:hypothetical protein
MDREQKRRLGGILAILASIVVALAAAVSSAGAVRWVEIVALFGGGFGAGAATTRLVAAGRSGHRTAP